MQRGPERRIVYLLTEGQLTEPSYFTQWARELREQLTIHIDDRHGTPMSLVEQAVEICALRRQRRPPAFAEFDQIWCVFDRDDHPNVDNALALASKHGIPIAFSNPCFELWLVLHAEELMRETDRKSVQAMSGRHGFTDGKALGDSCWSTLQAEWRTAQARSARMTAWHEGNGSPPRSNPSTNVGDLVEDLHRAE